MKLLPRLSITILSVLLILTVVYLALPPLLTEVIRRQLLQQEFTDIEIKISDIGFNSAFIEHARLSNHQFKITLKDLRVDYQLMNLLSGTLDALHIEDITLIKKPDKNRIVTFSLPAPEILAGFLALAQHEKMPIHLLTVNQFSLYDENRSLLLSATSELITQGQNISARFSLKNSRNVSYQIKLAISPETGTDIQLYSTDENPLSVNLNVIRGGNGLGGTIKSNLEQLAHFLGQSESLAGLIQADFSYYSEPDSDKTYFIVSTKGKQLSFYDGQVQHMQARLEGSIIQDDQGYQLEFLAPSIVTLDKLKQGLNSAESLVFKFPLSMDIKDEEVSISADQTLDISLENIVLDTISIAQAQLNAIEFTAYRSDKTPDLCKFKLQLFAPLIKIEDVLIEPTPVRISGVCPDHEEFKWSIDAKTEKIAYQDTDYQLSLDQCELQLGNSEQGILPDSNPDELGGLFSCVSSELSGKLLSRFRFNPINSTGRADYSILDIQPDSEKPLISSMVKNWEQPFDIVSGLISIQGYYRWWKNNSGLGQNKLTMDLDIHDAGGYYEGLLFSGLNYQDSIELLPEITSSEFSMLSIDHIDIALPVNHTVASIRFTPSTNGPLPLLTINDLVLALLDGEVKGNNINVDLNSDQHNLIIEIVGLDLEQIVELQQLDGLVVTGRINGTIPVNITPNGVKITNGQINAQDQGGRIQYIPPGDAGKSVPGADLVLKILEELDYNSLNVDVDYEEDGMLRMKLSIKGMSPQVDDQRPIHFNLNLEQNILTLLKGLRYAEGINNDIDRNVQKYFSEQKKTLH